MSSINRIIARRHFTEMTELERLIEAFGPRARVETVATVSGHGYSFPLTTISVGSENPQDPVLAFVGGVHGLEKIGSEVILAYMDVVLQLMSWDQEYNERLKRTRLLFFPMVNPIGIVMRWRSNGNGVDLMRNAPVEADKEFSKSLYCGHRLSPQIPWYRGPAGQPMEIEAQALCKVVQEKIFPSKLSLVIDIHSGFGARDRLWFPYAYSHRPYEYAAEVTSFKKLFDRTYPHHVYAIEPVSEQYLIHGDLWDHLALEFEKTLPRTERKNFFFPWTLEMGSWAWLKKNPRQILSPLGLFHPIQPHRHNRIMRRHITLFDFFHRSLMCSEAWLSSSETERAENLAYARDRWYA